MTDVFFATNRAMTGSDREPLFGDRFHEDGPQSYRTGVAAVGGAGEAGYEIQSLRLTSATLGKDRELPCSCPEQIAALGSGTQGEPVDIFLFIHGVVDTFDSAIHRAAQIGEIFQIEKPDGTSAIPMVFAFSWPSDGQPNPPWTYFSSPSDAKASSKAMACALLKFIHYLEGITADRWPHRQRLHLVSHSLGNWALRHALQGLRSLASDQSWHPGFDNIFLMTADENYGSNDLQIVDGLRLLPRIGRRIYVYHSSDELAMFISGASMLDNDFSDPEELEEIFGQETAPELSDVHRGSGPKMLRVSHLCQALRQDAVRDVSTVVSGLQRPHLLPTLPAPETGRRLRIRLREPGWCPLGPRAARDARADTRRFNSMEHV